jgi:arylsulfatase A-like enzyme
LLGYPTPRVARTDNVSPYHDRPWTTAEKARAAAIARLDADVGKIVEALETYKQTSNTLIILTSDNAPARQANAKNGGGGVGLRERDLRVPLVVRCPGMVAAKQVNDQPWAAWDILPTLVSVGRAQMPPLTDGISLWPLLTGAPQASRHDFLFWEYRDDHGIQQAVRTREWKAIKPHPDKPVELYNLSADPGEKTNVARSHVGELALLGNILMRYKPAGRPKSP